MRRSGAALVVAGLLIVLVGVGAMPVPGSPPRFADATTSATKLVGEGESWPEYTVRQLQNDATTAGSLGTLNPLYVAQRGESASRADLIAGNADFAVSEVPLSTSELAVATTNHLQVGYVP